MEQDLKTAFPNIAWHIQDELCNSYRNLNELLAAVQKGNYVVHIIAGNAVLEGTVDFFGEDYVMVKGTADDVLVIPFYTINALRLFNRELDSVMQQARAEEMKKQEEMRRLQEQPGFNEAALQAMQAAKQTKPKLELLSDETPT